MSGEAFSAVTAAGSMAGSCSALNMRNSSSLRSWVSPVAVRSQAMVFFLRTGACFGGAGRTTATAVLSRNGGAFGAGWQPLKAISTDPPAAIINGACLDREGIPFQFLKSIPRQHPIRRVACTWSSIAGNVGPMLPTAHDPHRMGFAASARQVRNGLVSSPFFGRIGKAARRGPFRRLQDQQGEARGRDDRAAQERPPVGGVAEDEPAEDGRADKLGVGERGQDQGGRALVGEDQEIVAERRQHAHSGHCQPDRGRRRHPDERQDRQDGGGPDRAGPEQRSCMGGHARPGRGS